MHVLGENIEMANLLEIRKCVGVIFQNPDEQIVGITVEEDIAFGLQNLMLQRDEIISRVDRMMKLLQLEEYRNHPVRTLSGGQKQLVAIAGILVMHPKIIVFDEATSMLDPQSTIHLHSLMSDLHQKGFTVIHVTHNPEDILKADRILVLNQGRLTFEGDVPTLMNQLEILQDAHILTPFVVRFKESLYRKGIELSGGCKSEKELAKSIWEYISAM
ncbi:Energy-coupling factor transporter ATP-binding protein EcfA1 [compost metagenome]